jgi:demethylmenaquinone methyltransferase / 2-methoxy-6-polyprenyl-1,4-benzoquinol methylase
MVAVSDDKQQDSTTTHFGYKTVLTKDKPQMVNKLFERVTDRYDLMNDLMSLGCHRVWKRFAVEKSYISCDDYVLDVACGTCDLTALLAKRLSPKGFLSALDYNFSMLSLGRDRMLNEGLHQAVHYIQARAESIPMPNGCFDVVTIAFGLRNVTQKASFLSEAYRVLKPSGRLLILEFSMPSNPLLRWAYDAYLFKCLPLLGEHVAGDRDGYQYLAESILMHASQDDLRQMCEDVGFQSCEVQTIMGGIVAIHTGVKI